MDGPFDRIEISSPQISPADAAAKECVAGQHDVAIRDVETHGAWRMSRRMERYGRYLADEQFFFVLQPVLRLRHRNVRHSEHTALDVEHAPQFTIVFMQTQDRAGGLLHFTGCQEVIEVRM